MLVEMAGRIRLLSLESGRLQTHPTTRFERKQIQEQQQRREEGN